MAPIDLRLRNLETGELLIASFETEIDAAFWLRERPPMMQVLGVISETLDAAGHAVLKRASRPLDEQESAAAKRFEDEAERLRQARAEEERQRAREEAVAYRESMRNADPNRPMEVAWSLDGGFEHVDPADEREINAEVREAVLAWVRERDEWVADRGLVVGEATVTVWPGNVPTGEARVQRGGTFSPVVAPPPVAAT